MPAPMMIIGESFSARGIVAFKEEAGSSCNYDHEKDGRYRAERAGNFSMQFVI